MKIFFFYKKPKTPSPCEVLFALDNFHGAFFVFFISQTFSTYARFFFGHKAPLGSRVKKFRAGIKAPNAKYFFIFNTWCKVLFLSGA
jgi:hypothetical protein